MKCSIPPATHHTVLSVLSSGKNVFHLVDVAISLQCLWCYLSLATTNALARGSLKDAANCAKHLELQISEKEMDSERILRVDLVSAHVIGGDRNMQSLELWSLSGLHMLSKVFSPTCSCYSTRLSFSSSIMNSFSWCSISVSCFVFENIILKTLFHARSRPVTGLPAEFKHINKRRTSN